MSSRQPSTPSLRLVAGASAPLSYTNRRGQTYYLHESLTKTGKPRYFAARSIREGAIATMPTGFELAESINGVVSVRRVDTSPKLIPDTDVAKVRGALSKHAHLVEYTVEERKNEIIVYEPPGGMSGANMDHMANNVFGLNRETVRSQLGNAQGRTRFDPVMKFTPAPFGRAGHYMASRMSYRGDGGWLPLSHGRLATLLRKYIRHIGTDEFFELF